jgi:hypothetical protein
MDDFRSFLIGEAKVMDVFDTNFGYQAQGLGKPMVKGIPRLKKRLYFHTVLPYT